jgi:hypothetical protein
MTKFHHEVKLILQHFKSVSLIKKTQFHLFHLVVLDLSQVVALYSHSSESYSPVSPVSHILVDVPTLAQC